MINNPLSVTDLIINTIYFFSIFEQPFHNALWIGQVVDFSLKLKINERLYIAGSCQVNHPNNQTK